MAGIRSRLMANLAPIAILAISSCAGWGQPAPPARIDWQVVNRFRLFAHQSDFEEHVKAAQSGNTFKTIFDTERALSDAVGAAGWAAALLSRLCYDASKGRIKETCTRDGFRETYLNSKDERIKLSVQLPQSFGDAVCTWTVGASPLAKTIEKNCGAAVDDQRVRNDTATSVRVVARNGSGQTLEATAVVAIKDLLIVGMGDSISSGEGNPVVPVALSNTAFCYRRLLSGAEFFLPGRAEANVLPNCPTENIDQLDDWNAAGAAWLYNACHRSIYGYQTRVALALAIENKNIVMTYLPLGCTGATIKDGMLGSQPARERPKVGSKQGPRDVEAQVTQLRNYLTNPKTKKLFRRPDAILLTIGANDIEFSGLVANVVVAESFERTLLKSVKLIATPDEARKKLKTVLKPDFAKLRTALLPFTNNSLGNVVFTTYANPATFDVGKPCAATRVGVDAHPAFTLDGPATSETVKFVETEFVPALKSFATCADTGTCSNAARDTMTYVDGHRTAFASHGFCALDVQPDFDRHCFLNGNSFRKPTGGIDTPLTCQRDVTAFHPYAKRSRWIRTVNDSFFAAMTYSSMGFMLNPSDIHDGRWGLTSVVYGGAIHPTGEGHAAMADSVIVAARRQLGLPSPPAAAAPVQ